MALKMGYATLRWRQPDLAKALPELKKAGWDGWEGRLPLDWLGPPKRLKQVCEDADMPLCVFTASGSPEDRDWEHTERNKRRMDFAAEMGVDCFMFMSGRKPEGRPTERADIERAAEGAEQWAEYAAQYGLELSYHIHTNLLVDSAEDWRLYMSLLDKARLCIDVSHAELWDYDPVQSLTDFWHQLNYVHLQDYTSCTVREPGRYNPEWVSVGEGECLDFAGVLNTLAERGFDRWVTSCPGEPAYEGEDPVSEARRSAGMRQYLHGLGVLGSEATLTQLTARIRCFVEERDWAQFHTPKDLAIGLSTEAAEVLEHFRFRSDQEIATRLEDESCRRAIGHELADALYFVLLMCDRFGLDAAQMLEEKLAISAQRYPVEKARGKNLKYTAYQVPSASDHTP